MTSHGTHIYVLDRQGVKGGNPKILLAQVLLRAVLEEMNEEKDKGREKYKKKHLHGHFFITVKLLTVLLVLRRIWQCVLEW